MILPMRYRFVLLLFLILALPRPAQGQGDNTILYGQTVSGKLDNATPRLVYTFQGTAGEIIDANLTRGSGDLDPVVILLSAAGEVITHNDDGGGGLAAAIRGAALPADGAYFIVVARFGETLGTTAGNFSLTLQRIGVASDPALISGGAQPIGFDQAMVEALGDTTPQRLYSFAALRGDIITIELNRISGDLDPVLIFADAEGHVILINDEDPQSAGTLDAAIRDFRIGKSGNYLIGVERFGGAAGTTQGAFALSLTRRADDQLGFTPELAEQIEIGEIKTGEISDAAVARYYLLTVAAGDVLTIEARRGGGGLDPTVTLLDIRLRVAAQQDSGARGRFARITAFRIPTSGAYVIVVSRFGGEAGRTNGGYVLTVKTGD